MLKNFDEKNIVLTLSIMSDVHISGSWYAQQSKKIFINALDYVCSVAKNPIDAYLFTGDFVDCMNSRGNVLLSEKWGLDYDKAKAEQSALEFETLHECFNNHIPKEAEIIYCLGNHDSIDCNNIARFIEEFSSREVIGDNKNFERMYRTDLDLDSMRKGMRHCVCKDYHFLCIDIVTDYTETMEFLKKNLDEITAKEPLKYVFVLFHYKAPDTLFASNFGRCDMADAVGELLKSYPQVVLLSGHTHTTICNERAIMQKEYTSIEGSCVSYVDSNLLHDELNVEHSMHFKLSEGLLVEIDKCNNLRITRLDYHNRSIIKDAWELPVPSADNSHLKVYSPDRKYNVQKPEFNKNADFTLKQVDNGVEITIPKAVRNNEDIFRYQIICYNSAGAPKIYFISSLFCHRADERHNENTLSAVMPDLKLSDIYKITVTAQDFWFNESEPLIKYMD